MLGIMAAGGQAFQQLEAASAREASPIKCSGNLRPDRPKTVSSILKWFGEHDLFWDAKSKMLASHLRPGGWFCVPDLCPEA